MDELYFSPKFGPVHLYFNSYLLIVSWLTLFFWREKFSFNRFDNAKKSCFVDLTIARGCVFFLTLKSTYVYNFIENSEICLWENRIRKGKNSFFAMKWINNCFKFVSDHVSHIGEFFLCRHFDNSLLDSLDYIRMIAYLEHIFNKICDNNSYALFHVSLNVSAL